jgi:hypothetical protein
MKAPVQWEINPSGEPMLPDEPCVARRLRLIAGILFVCALVITTVVTLVAFPTWAADHRDAGRALFTVMLTASASFLSEWCILLTIPRLRNQKCALSLAFAGNIIPFFPILVAEIFSDVWLTIPRACVFTILVIAAKLVVYPKLLRGMDISGIRGAIAEAVILAGVVSFWLFYAWYGVSAYVSILTS